MRQTRQSALFAKGRPVKAMNQPTAFLFLQDYFSPLVFQASMDSPSTIAVTLIDPTSGDKIALPGISCTTSLTYEGIFVLIQTIESRLAKSMPGFLARLNLARRQR
ncbi:hypothetical protein CXK95_01110 [Stutzerimonas degradans]|uniref:Uncharacterized protein n=2 Tax=Stutzerimonas degradans TaxID=2968968 RepID=A0A8E2U4Q7_9GAMM|nr:hypothetical protein CXK95_01110 [Stutzerimonas degradans]